jgi:hypothetical protein
MGFVICKYLIGALDVDDPVRYLRIHGTRYIKISHLIESHCNEYDGFDHVVCFVEYQVRCSRVVWQSCRHVLQYFAFVHIVSQSLLEYQHQPPPPPSFVPTRITRHVSSAFPMLLTRGPFRSSEVRKSSICFALLCFALLCV